ncbi:MAG: hypothetical protein LBS49_05250 [Candidatus Accumulibacter sp.]|nr:hypothetical protein [Accumulibacter sp.]
MKGKEMGGRSELNQQEKLIPDRERWIQDVSDQRLAAYERLMQSAAAPVRLDGSARIGKGEYFRDLVSKEVSRRKGE